MRTIARTNRECRYRSLLLALAAVGLLTAGCRTSARALGVVAAEVPTFQLVLNSLEGVREVQGHTGRASLPAGSYTVMRWMAEAGDRQGRRWQVRGGMWSKPVVVTGGKVTPIRLASPLQARLTASRAGERIFFRLELAGPRGELLQSLTVNGKPPPPRLQIRDAKGGSVADLTFEYG
jgi:hypothetical protein